MSQKIWFQEYGDSSKTKVAIDEDGDVVIKHRSFDGEMMTIYFTTEDFEEIIAAYQQKAQSSIQSSL